MKGEIELTHKWEMGLIIGMFVAGFILLIEVGSTLFMVVVHSLFKVEETVFTSAATKVVMAGVLFWLSYNLA